MSSWLESLLIFILVPLSIEAWRWLKPKLFKSQFRWVCPYDDCIFTITGSSNQPLTKEMIEAFDDVVEDHVLTFHKDGTISDRNN